MADLLLRQSWLESVEGGMTDLVGSSPLNTYTHSPTCTCHPQKDGNTLRRHDCKIDHSIRMSNFLVNKIVDYLIRVMGENVEYYYRSLYWGQQLFCEEKRHGFSYCF